MRIAMVLALLSTSLLLSLPSTPASAEPEPPRIIPQPVSQHFPGGPGVSLGEDSVIVVRRPQAAAVRDVAGLLAGVLRPSTGFALPVRHHPYGAAGWIELDARGPAELGQEGYRLRTEGGKRVLLQAHTAEGLFRGVQTLRQLLPAKVEAATRQDGPWTIPAADITDRPRFGYRGFMLDVGRRFVPPADVKRFIDQAARYKMNVFHWHLTEDQGWRIPIEGMPELTTVGGSTQSGWKPGTGGPWFYTPQEYRDIVAYAAQRYVTVVPEIDGPGHTAAALASVPGLNCNDTARPPYYGFDVRVSILCLTDERHRANVRDFVGKVFKETAALNPGPYLHIGGDEVPSVTREQYAGYIKDAADAAVANGKRVIGWHQIADGPLPPGSLLQYWGDASDRPTIGTANESANVRQIRAGLAQDAQVLVSPADRAYLDMKYDAQTPYGLQWAGLVSVQKAYSWDPVTALARPDGSQGLVTEEQVAGVEAALWTDRAYRGSSRLPTSLDQFPAPAVYMDYMSFPRLPALAEIAWSPAAAKDWEGFRARLGAHGPRWEAQGIGFFRSAEIDWR
ncbi:beta-N-acetylhexosaminidase [Nonomuraea africana]|uniref:beta-N-acetylhexosaminidase n=1 Tax=Nonomuraea africana TaxID=46171 RepID=UPI0033D28F0B